MIRRSTMIAVLLTVSMALSGCSVLTGEGATYVADEASVDDETVSETEFTHERSEWRNESRDLDVAGEERTINVSSYVSAYRWGEDRGAFAVLATPEVEVAGQSLNPVGDMSQEELIQRLEQGFEGQGDLQDLESERQYDAEIMGDERTVTEFSATAVRDGESADVVIHLTNFQEGSEIVIAAAVHAESDEEVRSDVETMLTGIDA